MRTVTALFFLATIASPLAGNHEARIYYDSNSDGNLNIWSMKTDGSDRRRLTTNTANDYDAAVSPDGTQVLFVSHRSGNAQIHMMDVDGSNVVQLTVTGTNFAPCWSADGSQIAFTSFRDGNTEIYRMDADGTNQIRLTNNTFPDTNPAWSPDGAYILYASEPKGVEIWRMNADGSNQVRLVQNTTNGDKKAAWSPDGTQIVYMDGPGQALWKAGADGSNRVQLTSGQPGDVDPAWSPDGSKIVFARRSAGYRLFSMNPDGSDQFAIPGSNPDERDPSLPLFTAVQVFPSAFEITQGQYLSGGLGDLLASDDRYLFVSAIRPSEVSRPSVEVVFEATSRTDSVRTLTFVLEAAASFSETPQWIDLWNYDSGSWERVDTRQASTNDAVVEVVVRQNAQRFVQIGTGAMKARVSYYDPGLSVAFWFARYDLVQWLVVGN